MCPNNRPQTPKATADRIEGVGHRREDMVCRKAVEASRESRDASCADKSEQFTLKLTCLVPGEAEPNRATQQTGHTGLDSERRLN